MKVAEIVTVTDAADERVADYVGLDDPELRRRRERSGGGEGGFFVAEGPLVVRRLLASPYRVRSVLATERGLRALAPHLARLDAPVYRVPQALAAEIAGFDFHRGTLASADRRPLPALGSVVSGATRVLGIEGVNDVENLGSLFRNAAAFGVEAVVLDPSCADPLYRRAVRVSMGHVLRVPFTRAPWPAALGELATLGFEVVALTPDPAAADVGSLGGVGGPVALLVGSEGAGLGASSLDAASRRVCIPMAPGVDSLNVATAAAIALHQLARAAMDAHR